MKKMWNRVSKKNKILFIILTILLIIMLILIGHKIYKKYLSKPVEDEIIKPVFKEEIDLDNYDYYLHGNATSYEESLFEELKKVLSTEDIITKDYASIIAKLFITDLFTLSNKNNSSDITSSQYVYNDYQNTFKEMIKDTLYSSIELNLDGKRTQELPIVKNINISSITQAKFLYNKEVLDNEAFYINLEIEYEKDLGYPINSKVVVVKNNDLLQVVKLEE